MTTRPVLLAALLLASACRADKIGDDTGAIPAADDTAQPVDTGPEEALDADGDGVAADEDCDDGDPAVGAAVTWYADNDSDGYGGDDGETGCDAPKGHVADSSDCDDDDPETYPGAAERCDDADNDCDGESDEDVTELWYADSDGDGDGDPETTVESCDPGAGWVADDLDCDDDDDTIHPDAEEVCDDLDNDCDGAIDDDDDDLDATTANTWHADDDDDGFGDPDSTTPACDQPSGWLGDASDCDDRDDDVNPDATEICDGLDNDCDDAIDDDDDSLDAATASTWYADADADGFGDETAPTLACVQPAGTQVEADDCNDGDPEVHPEATEICDDQDNDCDGLTDDDDPDVDDPSTWYIDADGDGEGSDTYLVEACDEPSGFVGTAEDCDDGDASSRPGGTEACDEADNDCDGAVDEGVTTTFYADADGDGEGDPGTTVEACEVPAGAVTDALDCDDDDASVSPAATELCDGTDNDCDGSTDEDDAADAATFYADGDADGYGDATSPTEACDAPTGTVSDDTDCDDGDAAVNPGATETCEGDDLDCDGLVGDDDPDVLDATTWYADGDGDGWGTTATTTSACEGLSGWSALSGDCDDGDANASPLGTESCDEADNDCDGTVDEGVTTTFYADADGDGEGDADTTVEACDAPSGYVGDALDCDDTAASVTPSATELCDAVDNDCDGATDEASAADAATWYADADGDGYGDADSPELACDAPSGTVADSTDCDDGSSALSPGADEVCDGVDNDCDSLVDDDDPDVTDAITWYLDADGDGYAGALYTTEACDMPSGFLGAVEDCDDTSTSINPEGFEDCNDLDDDCDDAVDEEGSTLWYADADGDGYGDPAVTTTDCEQPSGYVANSDDCDDTGPGDTDGDGLQDCEDDDIDGDGLRGDWDADDEDGSVTRGPNAGLGGDGAWTETGSVSVGGDATWSSTVLDGGAAAGDTSIAVHDAADFAEGDELLVLAQQGEDAGTHQFVYVAAVDGDTVTIEPALGDDYAADSVVLVQRVPHFTDVTLDGTLEAVDWSGGGGGVVVFRATGDVSIAGAIRVDGQGFEGGAGVSGNGSDPYQGESWNGVGATGTTTANEGGGGSYPRRGDNADSGGGGGYGSAGSDGLAYGGEAVCDGGGTYGSTALSAWYLGSGGGGGSPDTESDGDSSGNVTGTGGDGGGLIAVYAGGTLTVSGEVTADGDDGTDAVSVGGENGGAGGGSGGQILLAAPTVTLSGTVSAAGGAGSTSSSSNISTPYGSAFGGDGGDGRVRIDADSTSGTTSPSAYAGGWED